METKNADATEKLCKRKKYETLINTGLHLQSIFADSLLSVIKCRIYQTENNHFDLAMQINSIWPGKWLLFTHY